MVQGWLMLASEKIGLTEKDRMAIRKDILANAKKLAEFVLHRAADFRGELDRLLKSLSDTTKERNDMEQERDDMEQLSRWVTPL